MPINYNKEFPFDEIEKDETVYIVDFSIETSDMDKLLEITKDIHWIDHHKTSIEKYEGYDKEIKGLRVDGEAGCVLSYKYMYGDSKEVPYFTRLIGDRDIWKFKYGETTRNFCMGLLCFDTSMPSDVFAELQYDMNKVHEILKIGMIVKKFRDNQAKKYRETFGFEIEFEGYNCFAMNIGQAGSEYFGKKINEYDILISFVYDGSTGIWLLSLYTENKEIDVSEIAKKYGGGGHKGAAGFTSKDFPFKKINSVRVE